jgi:hypothetical protein
MSLAPRHAGTDMNPVYVWKTKVAFRIIVMAHPAGQRHPLGNDGLGWLLFLPGWLAYPHSKPQ